MEKSFEIPTDDSDDADDMDKMIDKSTEIPPNDLETLRAHIAELVSVPNSSTPTLSAFLDLCETRDYLRSKFNSWASPARSTLPTDQRAPFDEAKRDIENAIHGTWDDSVRSVAVFTRRGESPLNIVIPFQVEMELHFDVSSLPSIFPLVQLKDRFHRFVVVIASDESTRILEVNLGAITEALFSEKPEMSERIGRGWGRERFHQRKREHDMRFFRDQVTIISQLMSKRGYNHLILAGSSREVATLRDMLPKHIGTRLVGELFNAGSTKNLSVILEQAIDTFVEAERAESRGTVSRLHEHVRRQALAVVGVENSRDAILGGYASELVISEELPPSDREDLIRLATARNLAIEVCEGDELLATHGGVGCLLRYRPGHLLEG